MLSIRADYGWLPQKIFSIESHLVYLAPGYFDMNWAKLPSMICLYKFSNVAGVGLMLTGQLDHSIRRLLCQRPSASVYTGMTPSKMLQDFLSNMSKTLTLWKAISRLGYGNKNKTVFLAIWTGILDITWYSYFSQCSYKIYLIVATTYLFSKGHNSTPLASAIYSSYDVNLLSLGLYQSHKLKIKGVFWVCEV